MEQLDVNITSRDHRLVKDFRRLTAQARYRRETGRFACEGARLCADAVHSGAVIETVFCTTRALEQYAEYAAPLLAAGARRCTITEELARVLADTDAPQGLFCIGRVLDNRVSFDTIKTNGRYLALEDVQDPANLGAVIRTAEALGLDGLLLSAGCCDLYNPKVLRASMGGVFRLPFLTADDLAAAVTDLQRRGIACWACVPDGTATPLQEAALGAGTLCLIGNEGNGLRAGTIAACAGRLTIPMAGRAESLNAAACASIVIWELMRPAR